MTNNEILNELKAMIDQGASSDEIFARFADEQVYFPKHGINKAEKKQQLFTEWKMGASITDLILKYHWSKSSVYRFIREYLDAEQKQKETN